MDIQPLVKTVTKTLVILLFWIVFLLRIYLASELTLSSILFDLVISLFACGIFWILLTILVDTFLKSMVMSAKEKKVERFRGGISYHLAEPSPREVAWQQEFGEESKTPEKTK